MTTTHPPTRRRTPRIADGRGLTALGDVLLLLLIGGAGAALDLATGSGLRLIFAVSFGLACAFGALVVHREDLFASVVAPPLVFLTIALVSGAVRQTESGSLLTRQALELLNELILDAPVLLAATAAAALIAVVRGIGGRGRRR